MKMNKLFYIAVLIFLTLNACREKSQQISETDTLSIRLTDDSTSVELYPISADISEVLQDSVSMDSIWHNFFAVYPESEDPEMRDFQPALAGKYTLLDSSLKFSPVPEFGKGRYFARCYTPELLQEPEDIVSSRDLNASQGYIETKFEIK